MRERSLGLGVLDGPLDRAAEGANQDLPDGFHASASERSLPAGRLGERGSSGGTPAPKMRIFKQRTVLLRMLGQHQLNLFV